MSHNGVFFKNNNAELQNFREFKLKLISKTKNNAFLSVQFYPIIK
jgi:hypothetical protein